MELKYKGRDVYVEVDHSRAACDAYFAYGYYEDTGEILTDYELDALTDANPDALCEYCLEVDGYYKE
jgi:hypothetical protein